MMRPRSVRSFTQQRMILTPAPRHKKHKPFLKQQMQLLAPSRAVADVQDKTETGAEGPEYTDAHAHSLPDMFRNLAKDHPNQPSLQDPHRKEGDKEYTFGAMYKEMCSFAAGLASLGVEAGSIVGQFSESSARWLIADQGVMLNGAANAVRGATTNAAELAYIMEHSQSIGLILQDESVLCRLLPYLNSSGHNLRFVVVLWGGVSSSNRMQTDAAVLTYDDVVEAGNQSISKKQWSAEKTEQHRLATLVYTSGTSGKPKGAALSHSNILYQVEQFNSLVKVEEGDRGLSLLPMWHIYERAVQYHVLSRAACVVYSDLAHFKRDLSKEKPSFLCCVPLLLERLHARTMASLAKLEPVQSAMARILVAVSIAHTKAKRVLQGVDALRFSLSRPSVLQYIASVLTFLFTAFGAKLAKLVVFSKVREELGVQKAIICGGGSLAPHLDDFFEAMGLPVINGWGLTETSPVLACRAIGKDEEPQHNVRGTVGKPLPGTTIKVVDPDNLEREVPDGVSGVLMAKGPGVMSGGYWRNQEATDAAFVDGFFNTGDLGKRVPEGNLMSGQIMLTGRCKDTITLLDGENVAPQPIEDALCQSPLLSQVMIIGQDKRTLGALVCLDSEELERRMQEGGDERDAGQLSPTELNSVAMAEITKFNRQRIDAERFEVITAASVLHEHFSVENGTLTQTMKLRRNVVHKVYETEIAALLEELR